MIYPYDESDDVTPNISTSRDYSNININLLENKKFVRTTITNKDGTITTARINLLTGEVKPYVYDNSAALPKIVPNLSAVQHEPFWVSYLGKQEYESVTSSTIKRKNKANGNNVYLKDFTHMNDAFQTIPQLDDMITGVSNLNCGNNKPLSKSLLFNMLRDLDDVNQDTIQAYTGYSQAYCRRLAQYLRVLVNAFDNHVEL